MADDDLYYEVDQLDRVLIDGVFYRHTAPNREPLSGAGAAMFGARWNPVGTATLYLARPLETCLGEFRRMAAGQATGVGSFLPRSIHTIAVTGLAVLDLTRPVNRSVVGITLDDIEGPWPPCQQLGEIANTLGLGGILAPSATGEGQVLAVYVRQPRADHLSVIRTETYDVIEPSSP